MSVSGVFLFNRGAVSNLLVGSGGGDTLIIPLGLKVFNRGSGNQEVFPENITISAWPEKT